MQPHERERIYNSLDDIKAMIGKQDETLATLVERSEQQEKRLDKVESSAQTRGAVAGAFTSLVATLGALFFKTN